MLRVIWTVEAAPSPPEAVRCVDCHAVYEPAADPVAESPAHACPECGGTAWLAAEIPLPPESPAVVPT